MKLGQPTQQAAKQRHWNRTTTVWVMCWLTACLMTVLLACRDEQKPGANVTLASLDNMVAIPAGVFTLGTDDGTELEAPARPVTTSTYWIDKYEYPNVVGENPLVNVTWYQAQEKCTIAGKRLCTEREWEKACRGPEDWLYPYGDTYEPKRCRTSADWEDGFATIGSTGCFSRYGVGDMSGNIQEWTLGESVEERAVRGGFWNSSSYQARCTTRAFFNTIYSDSTLGFRCCKSE